MKRTRRTPEQIVTKRREIDASLAGGAAVEHVARQHGVSPATIGRWRTTHGGAKRPKIKRLKELEEENRRLKKAVADLVLDTQIIQEVLRGKD
ncbi:hypothetical protein PHYC_03249 [Phycisphaerales bacterium]|nr:hypothetical protein PHYC_03249 [Phycisphaerales bacterium]